MPHCTCTTLSYHISVVKIPTQSACMFIWPWRPVLHIVTLSTTIAIYIFVSPYRYGHTRSSNDSRTISPTKTHQSVSSSGLSESHTHTHLHTPTTKVTIYVDSLCLPFNVFYKYHTCNILFLFRSRRPVGIVEVTNIPTNMTLEVSQHTHANSKHIMFSPACNTAWFHASFLKLVKVLTESANCPHAFPPWSS